MKRNWYAAHDFIRTGKFKTPEKMIVVEEALKNYDVVVNWWCRQSGKTLTNIKIIRDLILSKEGASVTVVFPRKAMGNDFLYSLKRTLDKSFLEEKSDPSVITLTNGSTVKVTSQSSIFEVKGQDLVILEEFEFYDMSDFARIILSLKNEVEPSFFANLLRMMKFEKSRTKAILCSSMKDGANFEIVRNTFTKPFVITYLNWEKLKLDKEKLEKILGAESFKKEYDSYAPERYDSKMGEKKQIG
jgi:hypothetical protein